MRVIGLTGGIGSGKSTVARMFVDRGAMLLDADEIAREVTAIGSPVLEELATSFGPDVVRPDGSLDRALVAQRAFSSTTATARLNAITHPRIRERLRARLAAVPADVSVVIVDLPLLASSPSAQALDAPDPWVQLDEVVVVDVPESVQIERAVARGMAEDDVRQRMARQASRTDRQGMADHVIDNAGTLAQTRHQVDALWERWLGP